MKSRRFRLLVALFILMFFIPIINVPRISKRMEELITDVDTQGPLDKHIANGASNLNVIVSFNNKSFPQSVIDKFELLGGIVMDGPWNATFLTICGFSGILPSENISHFQNNYSSATVETNEEIEIQMNYIVTQAKVMNETWNINGYTGNNNATTAILDTGVDPNNMYFPDGYEETNLAGNVISWKDYVNGRSTPYDDEGHGTFISAVIAGTGNVPYNSSVKINVTHSANYSHTGLFGQDYVAPGNFSLKLATFNASIENSIIFINATWEEVMDGVDKYWIELHNDTELVNRTQLSDGIPSLIYHNNSNSKAGVYDLFFKYEKEQYKAPYFSLNLTLSFSAEQYNINKSHFTGVANASKLASYKVVNNSGIGNVSSLICALEDILLNRSRLHITAVCLSVATFGDDVDTINEVINNLIDNGTLVVIAAGNNGLKSADAINALASNKKAIVVGAINDQDQVTSYSSIGKTFDEDEQDEMMKPDIVAPGGSKIEGHRSVLSVNYENNQTIALYGTSIAAAVVSGAVQLLIEAKWNDWTTWESLDPEELTIVIKSTLLMTATETLLDREDDTETQQIDESAYSPSMNLGGKDIHEGWGRLNVEAAIDALTKNISLGVFQSDYNLTSSYLNPLGSHAWARQISLLPGVQYRFNLTIENPSAVLDLYLYSNETTEFGEPILLTQGDTPLPIGTNTLYFTPKNNQTNCVLVVKAITGNSNFSLNISILDNIYAPVLNSSLVESSNSATNYTYDDYDFYITYTDNDTSNAPPQFVYIEIDGKNYTMTKENDLDFLFTDGVVYQLMNFEFSSAGTYQYRFWGSDGIHTTKYPLSGYLNIVINQASAKNYPYSEDFSTSEGDWTILGNSWNRLGQYNLDLFGAPFDDRSRIYPTNYIVPDWYAFYFGTTTFGRLPYSYQPIIAGGDWIHGNITSPLINLTDLSENENPIAKFGLRVSVNPPDDIRLQIEVNWSGTWSTLRIYEGEEEWNMGIINLSSYKGSLVRFRFLSNLDAIPDLLNYKGFMLDYISVDNYTNYNDPQLVSLYAPLVTPDSSETQFRYDLYTFSVDYFDDDNSYPEYVYIEINNNNYSMNNVYGDWDAASNGITDTGIRFSKGLYIGDFSDLEFRFHAYDGRKIVSSNWYNTESSPLIEFSNPVPNNYTEESGGKGYDFNVETFEDFYITGFPVPQESTVWLSAEETWHSMDLLGLGDYYAYCGIGQINLFSEDVGYGTNWNARLLTYPLKLGTEHKNFIQFTQNISLEFEAGYGGDDYDECIISISTDFGKTWIDLVSYTYEDNTEGFFYVDISDYNGEDVMIKFELDSNNYKYLFGLLGGYGTGWYIKDLFIGYNKSADFDAPIINILTPSEASVITMMQLINATISDNVAIDPARVNLYINDEWVDATYINGTLNFMWDTLLWKDGVYTIKVVAYDIENNRAEAKVVVVVDNLIDWLEWLPWLIFIIIVVVASVFIGLLLAFRGKEWVSGIKYKRGEKEEKFRILQNEKDKFIREIECLTDEEIKERPYTYTCKNCHSWYVHDKYEWMCPNCNTDQLYFAYYCPLCQKWHIKDEPGQYMCKKCKVKLVKSTKERVKKALQKEDIVLKKFMEGN